MSGIDRRTFLELSGQSAVLLGLGLPGIAYAENVEIPNSATDDGEWEFYHPGVYNAQGAKLMQAFQEYLATIRYCQVAQESLRTAEETERSRKNCDE
jgi:hypothetical protein